ncbi:MAG: hypothetical protein ACMUIE_07665 [Thermoplasmatota archaeon]
MPRRGKKSEPEEAPEEKEAVEDVFTGELKSRRYGIRIDDDIEVLVIAGNELIKVNGRLLSMKDDLELVDGDGRYVKIIMDWVVSIKVMNHNRPPPDKDTELSRKPMKMKPKKANVDHAYN